MELNEAMLYPMMVNLQGKRCVVFGGGEVALRKCREILRCGARVEVYARVFSEALEAEVKISEGHLVLTKKELCCGENAAASELQDLPTMTKGAYLCFACTDCREVNQAIADYAREVGLWVNVSDAHGDSSFIVPSVRRRGEITLSVYSGENPAASRFLADKLLETVHESFLDFVAHTRNIRRRLKEEGVACTMRQAVMKRIFFDGPAELAFTKAAFGERQAEADADAILDEALNAERRKKEGESHK